MVKASLHFTFPPAAISPLKSTPHSPSSPRPRQPQTTTPPTLTLPATRDTFRRRRRARFLNGASYQRLLSAHLTAIFHPSYHLQPHPSIQIHSLNRAVFPSSTPAAYHRLSRSVRCCCLSAGCQQWLLTARSLSPISSAARAWLSRIPRQLRRPWLSRIPTQPSSRRILRRRLRITVR